MLVLSQPFLLAQTNSCIAALPLEGGDRFRVVAHHLDLGTMTTMAYHSGQDVVRTSVQAAYAEEVEAGRILADAYIPKTTTCELTPPLMQR